MPKITTIKDRELTSVRASYLKTLEKKLSTTPLTAILAPAGTGKTFLLKTISKGKTYQYIDLKKLSISPENFAIDFIGSILYTQLEQPEAYVDEFQDLNKLKTLDLKPNSKEIINKIENELQKIKPDQLLLTELAIIFSEVYASEHNIKLNLCLDNFDEILTLNNFSQIKDILNKFTNLTKGNDSAKFIVASSSIKLNTTLELQNYTLNETAELFQNIVGKTDERIIKEVHRTTQGLPVAINNIAEEYNEIKSDNIQKNITLIKVIIIKQLANKHSKLYQYNKSLLSNSLNKARGASLLKTIIKTLSKHDNLRLSEIARLIYRSSPVTKSLLERLLEVDLIKKDEKTFTYKNSILKVWCHIYFRNLDEDNLNTTLIKELGGLLK